MGGSLIAELNEYIHTYQIEERKASESLGNSQGEKLRKEKAAVEAREAARRKRGSNISNSQMAAMMSQGYDPKTTPKTRGRKINADSASSADTSAFSSPAYDGIDSPRSRLQSPDQQQRSTAETPRAGTHHPTVQDFYGFDTSDVADIEAQLAQPVMTQDISGAIDTTASDLQLTPRSAALLDSVLAGEALTTASGKVVAPAITVVSSERPPVPPSSSVEVKDGSDISSDEEDNNEGHDAAMESKNGSNAQHPDMGAGEITLRFPEREDTPTSEASASGSGSASEPEGSDIDESAADAPATSGEEDAQEEAEAEEDEEKKQSASEEEEAEQEPASPLSSEKNVDGVVNESFDVKPIAVPIEDGNIDVNAEETEA